MTSAKGDVSELNVGHDFLRFGQPLAEFVDVVDDERLMIERQEAFTGPDASMLDTPTVYRILSQIPTEVDLVFIGDPAQLPPIGPGLLFQSMVSTDGIPSVALDVIHRQADQTGIPRAGAMIRAGTVPSFRPFNPAASLAPGVFLVQARSDARILMGLG